MSHNEFAEVSHTIWCKILLGSVLKVITIGLSQFQSASNKTFKLGLFWKCGWLLLVSTWKENQQLALHVNLTKYQVLNLRTNVGYRTNFGNPCTNGHHCWWPKFWLTTLVARLIKANVLHWNMGKLLFIVPLTHCGLWHHMASQDLGQHWFM